MDTVFIHNDCNDNNCEMAGDSIHVLFGDSSDCKGYLIDSAGILQHCRCNFSAVLLRLLMPLQVHHLFNLNVNTILLN